MSKGSLSRTCTGSLAVYLIGYGVFLASFACANWVKYPDAEYSYGLWWNCSTVVQDHVCQPYKISELSSSWIAVQAFYIVAVILGFIAGTVFPKLPVNAAFQIISGAGILLSVIIFAAAVPLAAGEEYDFAFMIGPVAGILLLGNGLMLAISVRREGCIMDDVMPIAPGKKEPKVV